MDDDGGNPGLAFIVGGLVVLVVLLFFGFGGAGLFDGGSGGTDIDVQIEAPPPADLPG
jgi:hypothetical protein